MFVDSKSGGRHVEFIRDYSGRISGLRIHEGGNIVDAVKAR